MKIIFVVFCWTINVVSLYLLFGHSMSKYWRYFNSHALKCLEFLVVGKWVWASENVYHYCTAFLAQLLLIDLTKHYILDMWICDSWNYWWHENSVLERCIRQYLHQGTGQICSWHLIDFIKLLNIYYIYIYIYYYNYFTSVFTFVYLTHMSLYF